jgi:hypothetical protein
MRHGEYHPLCPGGVDAFDGKYDSAVRVVSEDVVSPD